MHSYRLFRISGVVAAFIITFLLIGISLAQNLADCPDWVHTALETIGTLCDATARNQACYGNLSLEATPQADVVDFTFNATGDIEDVIDIQSLRLTALNLDTEEWGVALMRLQANLASSQPKDLTLLTFGDVSLQNAVPVPTKLEVSVVGQDYVNVRRLPNTDAVRHSPSNGISSPCR